MEALAGARKPYFDANVLTYIVENADVLGSTARDVFASFDHYPRFTSSLSRLECLVMPTRSGQIDFLAHYEEMFGTLLVVQPVTDRILETALALRAEHPSLRTPDAIHIATSLDLNCDVLISNDRQLVKVSPVRVAYLQSLRSA